MQRAGAVLADMSRMLKSPTRMIVVVVHAWYIVCRRDKPQQQQQRGRVERDAAHACESHWSSGSWMLDAGQDEVRGGR